MKKILSTILFVLVMVASLTACKTDTQVKNDDISKIKMADTDSLPTPNVTTSVVPSISNTPSWFDSEEEFKKTIRGKNFSENQKYNGVDQISEYYRPSFVSDSIYFSFIQVKKTYVSIYYKVDGTDDNYWTFTWKRNLTEGQLYENLKHSFNEDRISKAGDYYVIDGNKESLYWESNGHVFHATADAISNYDEFLSFCDAEIVDCSIIDEDKNITNKEIIKGAISETIKDIEDITDEKPSSDNSLPTPNVTTPMVPDMSNTPSWFGSEEDFMQTIRGKNFSENQKYNGVNQISEYYRPSFIPENISVSFIQVTKMYVSIYYKVNGTEDNYWTFTWKRNLTEGQLYENLKRSFNEDRISKAGDYYVIDGNKESLYWESNGNVFHATADAISNYDEFLSFCACSEIKIGT